MTIRTAGIIGAGKLGAAVGRLAAAAGLTTLVTAHPSSLLPVIVGSVLPEAELVSWDRLTEPEERADVVVLDPPRAGAGRDVVATIADLAPRVVTYVACDPAALARDLGYFADRGYQVDALRGFDAFPMTQHVECIAVLRPRGEANAS